MTKLTDVHSRKVNQVNLQNTNLNNHSINFPLLEHAYVHHNHGHVASCTFSQTVSKIGHQPGTPWPKSDTRVGTNTHVGVPAYSEMPGQ